MHPNPRGSIFSRSAEVIFSLDWYRFSNCSSPYNYTPDIIQSCLIEKFKPRRSTQVKIPCFLSCTKILIYRDFQNVRFVIITQNIQTLFSPFLHVCLFPSACQLKTCCFWYSILYRLILFPQSESGLSKKSRKC